MQEAKFSELEARASLAVEEQVTSLERKLMARQQVQREIEHMKAVGEAYELSDEETRMLTAFRRFKSSCKAGAVFSWQTRPTEGVTVHADTSLIRDPQER
jgi:hypothetical protein